MSASSHTTFAAFLIAGLCAAAHAQTATSTTLGAANPSTASLVSVAATPLHADYPELPRDNGMIWPILRDWTVEEEERYAEWIKATVDEDFFVRHRIVTDCADVPYALRWIYARIRFLPQGVTDYKGRVLGNWDRGFAYLPRHRDWAKSQRFRRALERVLYDYTLVRSIPRDTYPIKVFPEGAVLRPGTVFTNELHSGIVWQIDPTAFFPIKAVYSTLPPKVRPLVVINFDESLTHRDMGEGLVNFSWWRKNPETKRYEVVPDEEMPGYSMEQYDHSTELAMSLQRAYSRRKSDREEALDEMLANLRAALELRVGVVHEGYEAYRGVKSRARNSYVYDCFSTPGRDARIRRKLKDMEILAGQGVFSQEVFLQRLSRETIQPIGLPEMTFLEYRHAVEGDFVSPEPWDPPHRRWGINRTVKLEWMQHVRRDVERLALTRKSNIVALAGGNAIGVFTPEGEPAAETLEMDDPVYRTIDETTARRRRFNLREGAQVLPAGDDTVFLEATGRVAKLDAQGKTLWERRIDSHLYAAPVLGVDGSIYIVAEKGFIMALSPQDGSTSWRTNLAERSIYPPVVAPSGNIFLACSRTVIALSPRGQVRWREVLPGVIYSTPAVAEDETVYIGSLDEHLHAISPKGKHLWKFPALSGVLVPPLVHPQGRVLFVSSGGTLYSLRKR